MDINPNDLRYAEDSNCPAGVVNADEQLIRDITNQILSQIGRNSDGKPPMIVPVGISARHVHLTDEAVKVLFGKDSLTPFKPLRQPGNYAANETVTIVGPRMRAIENVRVLGPTRSYTQVELSRTDGYMVGLSLPPRDSGKLENTPGITIVGPKGSLTIENGVIRAGRHIHISPELASAWGLKDQQIVSVECGGDKGLVFNNVLVRVASGLVVELHLDTDDANAADLANGDMLRMIV
jgi:putative phosphotransacetylase